MWHTRPKITHAHIIAQRITQTHPHTQRSICSYVQKYMCSQDNTCTPTQDSISTLVHSQDFTHYLSVTHPQAHILTQIGCS